MALSARAASPNAGRLYMEYACSPEAQKTLAESGEFVLYPEIYPTIKDAEKVVASMIFMDNPTAEQYKKLRAEFRQIEQNLGLGPIDRDYAFRYTFRRSLDFYVILRRAKL